MAKSFTEKEVNDHYLADKVAGLPEEITPQRDLWQGIERAIQNKPQHEVDESFSSSLDNNKKASITPYAWAASIIVAILVTWLSYEPLQHSDTPLTANNNSLESKNNSVKPLEAESLVSVLSQSFMQQKQTMLVNFGQADLKQLPASMQEQLTQLSQARLAIIKALEADENNVDLLNLLRFTQQQELNLLQQLLPYSTNNAPKWQTI